VWCSGGRTSRLGMNLPVTRPVWDSNTRHPASESRSLRHISYRCHDFRHVTLASPSSPGPGQRRCLLLRPWLTHIEMGTSVLVCVCVFCLTRRSHFESGWSTLCSGGWRPLIEGCFIPSETWEMTYPYPDKSWIRTSRTSDLLHLRPDPSAS
jgi:hypothetical protein